MTSFIDARCRPRPGLPRRCRGVATLFIVTLLLITIGLAVFFAARVSLTEQRLTANDVLADEALFAAQAGLEAAFEFLTPLDPDELEFDGDGWTELVGPSRTLDNGASYSTILNNDELIPWDGRLLRVEARGTSSDGIGARTMRQLARLDPWLANPPPAPLVVGNEVELTAGGSLVNPVLPYAVWSGGPYTATPPLLIDVSPEPRCPQPGVCDDDARLAGLSADALFADVFGRPPELLQALSTAALCEGCDAGTFSGHRNPLWIAGPGGTVTIAGGTAGTPASPAILVVDGDLRVATDTSVDGVVYVRGDWLAGSGRLTVRGAVIVAGAVREPGSPVLEYDPAIVDLLAIRGPYARIAGSWSDF